MPTVKNTVPIVLIILTGIAVYSLMRSKKLKNWRHHIITPAMKTLKMKTIMNREYKRTVGQ
ncbi:hypothetical protein [Flavobacterium sp.]|uniref:hypothetical protein n=1 Tax=Flavobacterium sp. TaxID=239 RepID=UPI002FDB385D